VARARATSRGRPSATSSTLWWSGIVLIALAVAALIALAVFYWTSPRPPVLRGEDLCPVTGPYGISVVLVDTSDDLLPATQKEVRTLLNDLINDLPSYYKFDVRVLDIPNARSHSLLSKCNPRNGTGLSDWTNNPTLMRKRWLESFNKPAEEAIGWSLRSTKSKSSPIMAAIQDIALDEFSAVSVQTIPKTLTIIFDMLEFTPYYGQYPSQGDLSYERFRHSPAYQKFWTDLHGARVTIDYVERAQVKIDSTKHVQFWQNWIDENQGKIHLIHRLQG
jgi:hypothetical protein